MDQQELEVELARVSADAVSAARERDRAEAKAEQLAEAVQAKLGELKALGYDSVEDAQADVEQRWAEVERALRGIVTKAAEIT